MTSSSTVIGRPRARTPWWRPERSASRTGPSSPAALNTPHLDSPAPFRALVAFTFILFISPQSYLEFLAPLRLALLTAAAAVMAYLYDRLVHGRPVLVPASENVLIAGLLGWAVLTLPFSYWAGGSVDVLLGMYIKTLVVFWLLSHVINTVPRLQTIIWALSLMALPLALTALANFIQGNYVNTGSGARIIGYQAPLTGNPNDLALTLNIILPLTVGLFLGVRRPALRAVLLTCIGLEAVAVIATYSRAGFLTLAVIFALYLWASVRRGRVQWIFPALLLALAAQVLMPTDYVARLGTITAIESDPTGSAQARWQDTMAAVKYVFSHPIIGAGLGMDELALNEMRGATWSEVHNVYLQYAVDLGLPGLLLFVFLLRASLKSAGRARHLAARQGAQMFFHLAEGIRISLIAFAVGAFFHPVAYHLYFYYIAGLALAAKMIGGAIQKPVDSNLSARASSGALVRHHMRSNEY